MEQDRISPPEARAAAISDFFDTERKNISDIMDETTPLVNGANTNGTAERKQQRIHLKDRLTELDHIRTFVSRVIADTTQTSEISSIRYYFVGKLDEIDLEIERAESQFHGVFKEEGVWKGKKQEVRHWNTVRSDMLRVGNHVLGLLGQPPLVDEKISATV